MAELIYSTGNGHAWVGDAATALREMCAADSVDLIVTSPPFALLNQKDYGNGLRYLRLDGFVDRELLDVRRPPGGDAGSRHSFFNPSHGSVRLPGSR